MIACEIQLRYVIRDKIQSKTNSVRDKIQSETKFLSEKIFFEKNFYWEKSLAKKNLRFYLRLNFVSDFQCTFLSCLGQIDAYHH